MPIKKKTIVFESMELVADYFQILCKAEEACGGYKKEKTKPKWNST